MHAIHHGNLDQDTILALFNARLIYAQTEGGVTKDRKPFVGGEEVLTIAGPFGGAIAWAVFYQPEDYNRLWLDVIFVSAVHRRQGMGQALLRRVVDIAKERGLNGVSLGTGIDNLAMLATARKAGLTYDHLVMTARFAA